MRPQFHFASPSGWINDPHGITYRDGQYHLFYQYVPGSMLWAANCHWGHAISNDMFAFQQQPIAIAPGDGDDGIWTGSLITDDSDSAAIYYTSVAHPDLAIGTVRIATPSDAQWIGWEKGPVVASSPSDLDIVAYRDPFVFREGDHWRMFVGASLADRTATALSYRSEGLRKWTYEGVAASRSTAETSPTWTGSLWECPQLFELDGRHVMVTSVWDAGESFYAAYGIGSYIDGAFHASSWGQLSYGTSYYAPSLFRDSHGTPCLTFWLRGVHDDEAGWAGAHSVPHTLSLHGETLIATPHPGLDRYRRAIGSDHVTEGLAVDISWSEGRFADVRSGGSITTSITVDDDTLTLTAGDHQWTMPHDGGNVRIIIDGPIIEISTRSGLLSAEINPLGKRLNIIGDGTLVLFDLVR